MINFELLKIIRSPVVIGLFILALLLNVLIISANWYIKDDVRVVSNLADETGYQINDTFMKQADLKLKDQTEQINEIVSPIIGKEIESVFEIDQTLREGHFLDQFNDDEFTLIYETSLIATYLELIPELDLAYQELTLTDFLKVQSLTNGLTDKQEAILQDTFTQYEPRFSEIKETKEYKSLYVLNEYQMHENLYRTLWVALLFELLLIGVLITAFSMNYEFEQRTHLHTYATKRGRKLMVDKAFASLTAVVLVSSILIISTVLIYAVSVPMGDLWHTPVTSFFNWSSSMNYPYFTWWNLSVWQFLALGIAVTICLQLIFSVITVVFSIFIKHTYMIVLLKLLFVGLMIVTPFVLSLEGWGYYALFYQPYWLLFNPHMWFTINFAPLSSETAELMIILIWALAGVIAVTIGLERFKRQDI